MLVVSLGVTSIGYRCSARRETALTICCDLGAASAGTFGSMCGRYKLQDPEWVEADFSTTFPTLSDEVRRPRYNVAPGQLVLAVSGNREAHKLEQMFWGIEAQWKGGPPQLINARGEKLAGSNFWRPLLAEGRCAIPADGFYEWKDGKPKQPYLYTRSGGEPWYFAGLFDRASRVQDADNACVIVTVEPNELVEDVHDRMPAMLRRSEVDEWLGGDVDGALAALRSFPSTEMSALAIGRAIGNSKNEGPELIEPATPEGPATASLF